MVLGQVEEDSEDELVDRKAFRKSEEDG